MNASTLQAQLIQWTIKHSGLEQHRPYLGMSSIHRCARELFNEFNNGRGHQTQEQHLACYTGYLFESDIKARLGAMGLYVAGSERELVAPWDKRYRGHTDGELDGRLLEIKSVTSYKLGQIQTAGRLPGSHYEQVQTYMRHGAYTAAFVVYVARDSNEIHVADIWHKPDISARLDKKAKEILAAVDGLGNVPRCTCGRCER